MQLWLCGLNSELAERMRATEVKPGDVDVRRGGRVIEHTSFLGCVGCVLFICNK